MKNSALICRVLLLVGVVLHPRAVLRADGGAICLSERKGAYQITVFTSPTPMRVGPVDVSVLIQDAGSGEPVSQVDVLVRVMPHGRPAEALCYPATTEAATNKLFRAAVFDLPEPGLWDVEITLDDQREPITVRFELNVQEPGPRLGEMTPWIAWPAAILLLFGVHQWLVRRRSRTNDSG